MNAGKITTLAGFYGLAMIVGALGFQYIGGVEPCEMCHWQRWPLIGAAVIGFGTTGLVAAGLLNARAVKAVVWLVLALIAVSGAIGAYQAGVEWKFLPGPASCTGSRFVFAGLSNLNNEHVVRCDEASWRLLGISLAGYNAIFSLGAAALGTILLLRRKP